MTERTHDEDHEQLADELDKRADELDERSDELAEEIEDTRTDWRAKRRDDTVPGAPPPPRDEDS